MLDGSDDEKEDYTNYAPADSSVNPDPTVDTPMVDRSPSPTRVPPPLDRGSPATTPSSRGKKRKAKAQDAPSGSSGQASKQTQKIGHPSSSKRKKAIVNHAFVELNAKPNFEKGKVRICTILSSAALLIHL